MDTVADVAWTVDSFLAWEDRQEGKHEFDGRDVVPMTGGSITHQRIGANMIFLFMRLLAGTPFEAYQEMRLRCGQAVRYPDLLIWKADLDQRLRTIDDAFAIFEVLSDDTADTDRVAKLVDYAALPSLRSYVLLEQDAMAATFYQRDLGGVWASSRHTAGDLVRPGLDIAMPLAALYRRPTFGA